jgi:hypothetical protein
MGQAKLRRMSAVPTVYHHTSTLRTNEIWMSGKIKLEGQQPPAVHPKLGKITTNANLRRSMRDFPPLAWFTARISVPRCLVESVMLFRDEKTGEVIKKVRLGERESNAMSLHRIAIGFPVSAIPVVPWPDHPGYGTAEGRELNETARDVGDNPADWWVSEEPVEVLSASEIWGSGIMDLKLRRRDGYLKDVKRMVELCRTTKGVFIPPSWLSPEETELLRSKLGVPIAPVHEAAD